MTEISEKLKNSDYLKFIRLKESGDYVFASISACKNSQVQPKRGEKTGSKKAEIDRINRCNSVNTHSLKDQIKCNDFDAFDDNGVYPESEQKVFEKSFVVYTVKERRDELFNFAIACCSIFDQECILFTEVNGSSSYYDRDGQIIKQGCVSSSDKFLFNVDDDEDFYTKLGTKRNGRNYTISFKEMDKSWSFRERMLKASSSYILDVKKLNDINYRQKQIERIKTIVEV